MSESRLPLALDRRTWLAAVLVGVLAAAVSLLRLWLGNHDALTQVVWAEDGVFPLCVEKAGFGTCLIDPFAGYLLALPRVVAGPVAWLPPESWALATNLIAAALAGVVGGSSFAIVRRFGLGWISSLVIGFLPVIVPVVGLESINAIGSSYMLLLYVSVLVLVFPVRGRPTSPGSSTAIAALLLLTTLTIPTAGALAGIIIIQGCRRVFSWLLSLVWIAVIAFGLVAQWLTATRAAKPREITPSWDSFNSWLNGLPETLLTYWPGLRLESFDFFGVFPISPFPMTGAVIALAVAVGGTALIIRGGDARAGIGLLLLTGMVTGAVPAIIGGNSNRYFVVPLLLWGAAAMVALDPVIRRTRWWVIGIVCVLVTAVWWTSFPASWFRTRPAPPWTAEVARVENVCRMDPGRKERIIFSPYWPPNWGDALSEPTHPDLPCVVVWSWLR